MKKEKKWFVDKWTKERNKTDIHDPMYHFINEFIADVNQLDEPEVLLQEWIEDNEFLVNDESGVGYTVIESRKLKGLLVPEQEEVDRAYKDGYEKGKQHTFYKGYLEGLADKESEPETVADVIADFFKSLERLKEVMSMEVEELEE